MVTLVDRKSRFLAARNARSRKKVKGGRRLITMLSGHHSKTLTVDNGREFYGHKDSADSTGVDIYFADP